MPGRTRLTKNDVLRAAVALINEEGSNAVSLHRLAEKLGIRTPSLYNHIEGLPGLQRQLATMNASLLADRMNEAAIGKSGSELFMAVAQAFRSYVKENPGLYLSTLRSSGVEEAPDPSLIREEGRALKVGLAIMTSLGLEGDDAVHGLRAFRSMVHGFATLEVAGGFGLPQDCDESFRRLVEISVVGIKNLKSK
jgi:AcrR family transcriptional regulator